MIEDILKNLSEVDPIDDKKVGMEDWGFLAAHLADVPVIDTLLKRMMSDSIRSYFNSSSEESRTAYKVQYRLLEKIRKFVEKEKLNRKKKTQ